MTFTCFKDKKLYSKKEWILPDFVTNILYYFIPLFIIIYAYCLFKSILTIKKNKIYIIPILLLLSCYFVDLLSACYHCLYIDGSYNYLHNIRYEIEDGFLIVNTNMGYASCHHIFPSNWKDIKDTTLFSTMFILVFLPLHRPKRKMRQTFYKKIKNYQFLFFGDVKAPLKGVILFDDYNLL